MAPKLLALVVLSLISSVFSQCTVEKAEPFFRRSVYEFSLELVQRVALESDNHFVTSAVSPWILLNALSFGAVEDTYDEIKEVLRLHPHQCFNKKFFEIVETITAATEGATLERSSTIFVQSNYALKDTFKRKVVSSKVSNLEEIDFTQAYESANTINDYVSRATHGSIDDIVSPSDLDGILLLLVDALYFKGSWKTMFSSADTENSAFYNENGEQIGDVNLMFSEQYVNSINNVNQIGASVLELPYGNDDRFAMLFYLPNHGQSLAAVIENMKKLSLSSILAMLNSYGPERTMVQIPRFAISSDLSNMKELLSDMGLRTMFDSNMARFDDLSDYPTYVSSFVQKANVEVTEEGTEASAASAAAVSGRSLGSFVQFTANKPFLYMIVDKKTEVPLFTGAYSKPTLY